MTLSSVASVPFIYTFLQAKAGDPPSKGDLNMVAMLLTRRLEDGVSVGGLVGGGGCTKKGPSHE